MMKAITINRYGPLSEMHVHKLPIPDVGENDVLIEVHAAAVNPVDIAIRNGWLQQRIPHQFPLVLGWDVAGVVKAVGSSVSSLQVGDEVYSYPDLARNGTYADYIAVNHRFVSHKPKNITFEEAASIPLVGTCAFRSLVEVGNIQEGQRVLILGGSGGVGSFAIQLAKSYGTHVVTTTSTKNIEFVKQLGADEVIDYTNTELSSYGGLFDIVFDAADRKPFEQSFDLVKKGGKIISVATFPNEEDLRRAAEKEISVQFLISNPSTDILPKISSLIESNKIKPVIGSVFSMDEAQKAHELSETNHARGKIVLKMK
ncbi:NADP-dependent oxidoreductase [Bacillus sp. 31A1R]|uniref:NADP-dependent oxidoreductase n=1 Tax=Robertmurraya mangrovi TaxID=3098077 RepID=A0ABU5ITJ9_9BACI|nr:NADP-dependent oxidoreductase [Bacillus sp. 31A1R]MDZ5470451.1 NADP-dependent oxidoreductase [Bacillus sp. 31A1R]